MSGEIQARRQGGSKLKNRNKKRVMQEEPEKEDEKVVVTSDNNKVSAQSRKNRKQKTSSSQGTSKGKHQQSYYQELSAQELLDDTEDESYDYDLASPRSSSFGLFSMCARIMFIILFCTSIGFVSLYFYNPKEFWTTLDKVDHHLKPLGANIIWPDFQGIHPITFDFESAESLLDSVKSRWNDQILTPLLTSKDALIVWLQNSIAIATASTQSDTLTTKEATTAGNGKDSVAPTLSLSEDKNEEVISPSDIDEVLEPSFQIEVPLDPAQGKKPEKDGLGLAKKDEIVEEPFVQKMTYKVGELDEKTLDSLLNDDKKIP